MLFLWVLTLSVFSLTSCSNSSTEDFVDTDITKNATYKGAIKTIIDTNCVNCHANPPRNGAQFPMTTYEELVAAANTFPIIARMTNASNPMPPSGLLPAPTVELVNKWITNGFPEE